MFLWLTGKVCVRDRVDDEQSFDNNTLSEM